MLKNGLTNRRWAPAYARPRRPFAGLLAKMPSGSVFGPTAHKGGGGRRANIGCRMLSVGRAKRS
jgi:hypothetical protein